MLALIFSSLTLLLSNAAHAGPRCLPPYSTKELCVFPGADLSRIERSPEVMKAAQVVAKKMKPYFPASFPMMKLVMGYRSPEAQNRIRRSGVRAGPSSGRFVSAHIYGVAVDIEIEGNRKLGKELCAALNQIMPMLKNKGGVIMEGSGGGSTNGHIDDNWGARFAVEKTGKLQTLNYTGGECPPTFGVTGPSAEQFKEMAKITVDSLEQERADVDPATLKEKGEEEEEDEEVQENQTANAAPAEKAAKGKGRKPSSWAKYH